MRTIIWDTETRKLADDVIGGWNNAAAFGLALCVTWDEEHGFRRWWRNDADALAAELARFDRNVGWNNYQFDLAVLYGETTSMLNLWDARARALDLCASIKAAEGVKFTRPLDDVARATLGRGKTGDGADAPALFRNEKFDELVQYCQADVALTRDLYIYGVQHGYVLVPPAPWRPNDPPGKVAVTWGEAVTA